MDRDSVVESYLTYLPNLLHYSSDTARNHKSTLGLWFSYLDGLSVDYLKTEKEPVLSWIEYRQEVQRVKEVTIAKNLCVLRTFYTYLWEQQILPKKNPVQYLPSFICKSPEEGDYLSVDECFGLLESIDTGIPLGLRNYTMIALMWSAGLRSNELVSLQWRDIDLADGHFIVRKGKGNKQRQIYLAPRIHEELQKYKQSLGDPLPHQFVFEAEQTCNIHQKSNRQLSTRRLCEIIRIVAKQSGIKRGVGARALRHTFATHMYDAGVSIIDLKEIMGHDDTTETTIYIHVTPKAAKQILARHTAETFE